MTLFSILALFICFQVFLEASVFPAFKDSYSSRPFAGKIQAKYNMNDSTYVINDLSLYRNLYGLNFYMGNHFKNFEKELPAKGYLILGLYMKDPISKKYSGEYTFEELDRSTDKYNDFNDIMVLYMIHKTGKK